VRNRTLPPLNFWTAPWLGIGHRIKFAGAANFGSLDAHAGQNTHFFGRVDACAELTSSLGEHAKLILHVDEVFGGEVVSAVLGCALLITGMVWISFNARRSR
jgi:hypothetical protein